MALGGVYSVFLGQDLNFDLLNYHLYNPYAFLNGKIGRDFMAAGVHSCLNPLLDIYFYILFRLFFNHPSWIAFCMGLPYGALAWAAYHLAKEVFRGMRYFRALSFASAAIGLTSAGVMSQIGTTTNEIPLALMNVVALWMTLIFIRRRKPVFLFYSAAFLAGAAAGLKLTASSYCVALLAAASVSLAFVKKPLKTFGGFVVCAAAGFLLANGWFLWKWLRLYGNPVFPYYNQIFHSPYFEFFYLTERRFFPSTVLQWLFYPFYWAFSPAALVSEVPVCDMRLAAALAVSPIWGRYLCLYKNKRSFRVLLAAAVYFAVGYICWLSQFSILRYAAVLEVLCGILLVGACAFVVKNRWGVYIAWIVWGVLAVGYKSPDWQHRDFAAQAITFDHKPKVEDDALVFFMHLPSSYLAPLLNPKAVYMGGFLYIPEEYPDKARERAALRNNIQPQYLRFRFEEAQRDKIARHQGPIYIVSIDWPYLVNPATLARFNLRGNPADCVPFITNWTIYSSRLAICRVEKII